MTNRKFLWSGLGVWLIFVALILVFGRRSSAVAGNSDSEKNNNNIYSDLMYNQGNLIMGSKQTFDGAGHIITSVIEQGKEYTVAFNVDTSKLTVACYKAGCLHTGNDCIVNVTLNNMQNVGDIIYFVPYGYDSSIWSFDGNEINSVYKNDEAVANLRIRNDYIYFSTDTGIYRVTNDNGYDKEQIWDTPPNYSDIFIYGDKIYLALEDEMLYSMNCDGSDMQKLLDEKIMFPQVYKDRIYLRSVEYDSDGMWNLSNELFSVATDGTDRESLIDEVYQYVIADGGVYYTTLPDANFESSLHFYNIETGEDRVITDGVASGSLAVFEETSWIIVEKYTEDTQIDESKGETGGAHTHLYCIRKDGTDEICIDYPEIIQ